MKSFLFLFLNIFLISSLAFSEEIYGEAKVIDGDTLRIKKSKIRLEGIDAPEMKQKCKKPYLQISNTIGITFNREYNCGQKSKKELESKIKKTKIKCIIKSKDKYKRHLATCFKGDLNLNQWMVKRGYAVAYKRYSKQYLVDEQKAKEDKLGIWEGSFIRPEKWRKLN